MFENDCGALVKKGSSANVEQTITLNENISAPLHKGDVIGKAVFSVDGENVGEVNIVSDSDVEKMNFVNIFKAVSSKWCNLLREN